MDDKDYSLEVRNRRHALGYAPQPPSPAMPTWKPEFTVEEKKAHDQYVIDNRLPF